jgi:hypothetical protein
MTDHSAPFQHNKLLYDAQQEIIPLVLRDFVVMKRQVEGLIPFLEFSIRECENAAEQLISESHGDDCEACIILRNMHLRFEHDLSLYRAHLNNTKSVWAGITRKDAVNSATPELFLGIALTTRALLDAVFRSAVLYSAGDIRAYNKQIADSLHSFSKLVWSTLPQNIHHNIGHVLDEYGSLSNSKKNDSPLYADPAPTFKSKVAYMRGNNTSTGFADFFEECESFYNALSDMVHGGSAAMAASNLKGAQIVMGVSDLKYVASAHQLAELIGVATVLSHKLLVNFYIPVLVHTLSRIEGADAANKCIAAIHESLLRKAGTFSF